MRRKFNIPIILGCTLLTSGLITYGVYSYSNAEMQRKITENLNKHTIYVTQMADTGLVSSDNDGDTDVSPYAGVSSDQKVKKVKSYKRVLSIPSLKIKAYVYEGVGHDALTYGVGRYTNSGKLNGKGNIVIAGHSSDIYDCILDGLHKIKTWAKILIYDDKGTKHTYYVVGTRVVEPTDFSIFNKIDDRYNQLTLFTCTDSGQRRFVVFAFEMTSDEMHGYRYIKEHELYDSMLAMNKSFNVERLSDEIDARSYVSKPVTEPYFDLNSIFLPVDPKENGIATFLKPKTGVELPLLENILDDSEGGSQNDISAD